MELSVPSCRQATSLPVFAYVCDDKYLLFASIRHFHHFIRIFEVRILSIQSLFEKISHTLQKTNKIPFVFNIQNHGFEGRYPHVSDFNLVF